jgi:hypothetical protein
VDRTLLLALALLFVAGLLAVAVSVLLGLRRRRAGHRLADDLEAAADMEHRWLRPVEDLAAPANEMDATRQRRSVARR